eukprot:1138722-Pelagomonas_calceolata.AAC.2
MLDRPNSQGFSPCHPVYDDHEVHLTPRYAIYSAILQTSATATFILSSSWGGPMSKERKKKKKKRKKKKLRRQRKLSLHQLRKERHIGSKSRESPSPEGERGINVDQVVFWQCAAPGHQCYDECFYIQWHCMGSVNSLTHTQEDWVDSNQQQPQCVAIGLSEFALKHMPATCKDPEPISITLIQLLGSIVAPSSEDG